MLWIAILGVLVAENPKANRGRTFDEESRELYGGVAPPLDQREISSARAELERLLPGNGPLATRYTAFQKRYLVPPERLEPAFRAALEESRKRTRAHFDLPPDERVSVEFVSGAPWPSFSRYDGSYRSVVQLNRDFPLPAGSLLEIAAHEAYPGHHTLAVLRERFKGKGPGALFEEGLASYGLELAFPGEERLRFVKEVLFPLAGVDPSEAEPLAAVEREMKRLAPLRVEGARAYLDRKRDRVQSVIWLENEALVPAPWAFLRFVDRYRTYVVTYTLGPDLVRRQVENAGRDPWQEYLSIWLP
jgi:hypothetical protein